MIELVHSQERTPPRLLQVTQVRASLLADEPEYGKSWNEGEWEAVTLRLEALARVLWEFSRTAPGRTE